MAIHDPMRPQHYPMDDLTYDVITILHEKSKALEAYGKYLKDARKSPELLDLLEQIREDDEDHVEELKEQLRHLLAKANAAGDDESPDSTLPRTEDSIVIEDEDDDD